MAALVDAQLFACIRRMQARLDALCQRIESGFADTPEAWGLAEIDAAVAELRAWRQAMPTLRVVLDTNVLLSGIAYPASVPGQLIGAWRHDALEVVLSAFILDELRRVLPGLSQRHGLSAAEIEDLVDILSIQAEVIEPAPVHDPALTDFNDQPVLGMRVAALEQSHADALITGDRALLELADRYPIRTPADFWAAHGGSHRA